MGTTEHSHADMPVAPRVVQQVAEAIGWRSQDVLSGVTGGREVWVNWDLRKLAPTGQAALTTDDMLAWLMARAWVLTIHQRISSGSDRGLVNVSAELRDGLHQDPKTALGVGTTVWAALVRLVGRIAGIPLTDGK